METRCKQDADSVTLGNDQLFLVSNNTRSTAILVTKESHQRIDRYWEWKRANAMNALRLCSQGISVNSLTPVRYGYRTNDRSGGFVVRKGQPRARKQTLFGIERDPVH